MKTITSSLQNFLLANTTFNRAYLITISLINGQTLNVVDGTNVDITYQGTTYCASKFGVWTRGPYKNSATFKLSAEPMTLSALIKESVNYPGTTTPLMQVINLGMLAGASVSIQTLYWPIGSLPPSGFSMGTMKLMNGSLGGVRPAGRSKITCEVFDSIYLLNREVPPFVIMSGCRHSLFDSGCALNVADFQSTNIALALNSTSLYLNLSIPARLNTTAYVKGNLILIPNTVYLCTTAGTSAGSPPAFNPTRAQVTVDGGAHWTSMGTPGVDSQYPLGYVIFTSGQNSGLKASIKTVVTVALQLQLQLLKPLPFAVNPGDTVQLIPGCDKSLAINGCGGYANQLHYGGQPYVPNPEVAQ